MQNLNVRLPHVQPDMHWTWRDEWCILCKPNSSGIERKICVINFFARCTPSSTTNVDDGVPTAIKNTHRGNAKTEMKKKRVVIWWISPNHSIAIGDCWMFGFYRQGVTERLPAPPLCWTFSHIFPVPFYHWPHDLTFSGWCLALFSLNSYFISMPRFISISFLFFKFIHIHFSPWHNTSQIIWFGFYFFLFSMYLSVITVR